MKISVIVRHMAVFTFLAGAAFSVGVIYGQHDKAEKQVPEVTEPEQILEEEVVVAESVIVESATTTEEATSTNETASTTDETASTTVTSDTSLIEAFTAPKQDLTKPEEEAEKTDIQKVLEKRPASEPTFFNFFAYWVQKAIALGIPANTIVLIFLVPVIATLITFVRVIIGLPSLEMLVPIVLAFAFVAVGITAGLIILSAVIFASFVSRTLLRRIPLMYFPKRSLSHLFLAIFVFAALTLAIILEFETIRNLSIFPILILTLLGDSVVSVQLRKSVRETVLITAVTLGLALVGYMLATSVTVRDFLILWPELILLTVPVNFLLGRYFGLRLSELFRFRTLESYASE